MMTGKEFEEFLKKNSETAEIHIARGEAEVKGEALVLGYMLVEALEHVIDDSNPVLAAVIRCYAIESLQKTADKADE